MKPQHLFLIGSIVASATLSTIFFQGSTDESTVKPSPTLDHIAQDGWKIRAQHSVLFRLLELKEGDVVLKLNDAPFLGSPEDFQKAREHCEQGRPVSVVFERDGEIHKRTKPVDLSKVNLPDDYEFGAYLLNCDYQSPESPPNGGDREGLPARP